MTHPSADPCCPCLQVLAEYADFYDYSTSYPDGADPDAEVPEPDALALDADGFQLVLPSGATVGHRALARYYRLVKESGQWPNTTG